MKDQEMSNDERGATDAPDASAENGKTGSDEPETESKDDRRQEDEIGGPKGPEPTRYGDWERKGRCIDF